MDDWTALLTHRRLRVQGNVAAVDSHPLSMGSSSGAHYGGNAETYMNIGQAMGAAMVKMLK